MKYKLYADTHLYSPIEILRTEVMLEPPHENTIFMGDVIDMANVAKKQIKQAKDDLEFLINRHKQNFLFGNHERWTDKHIYLKKNGIIFDHGDLLANPKKWSEYRRKPWGAGFLKRKLLVPFIAEAEKIIDRKLKDDFVERVIALLKKEGCFIYVCAHFHPEQLIDNKYGAYRIIVLPRGRTELEL